MVMLLVSVEQSTMLNSNNANNLVNTTMRTQGKITYWNEEKGYGFITPAAGAKQVFVHIRAFSNHRKAPVLNQIVTFSLSTDKQGRPCAVNVTRAGEKQPGQSKRKYSIVKILMALIFLVVVTLSVLLAGMHEYVLYAYLATSVVTFAVYAFDKSAARKEDWRTPEFNLHMLALLGGWPGALVAQETLRHKTQKEGFRALFWVTVVVNCGIFVWFFTSDGTEWLQALIAA
jgi:uncharacterized membrane protein YsdA (DUF1294 family)/cold shock CspA family protein